MTAAPPVRYRIVPNNPAAHLFEVTCTVADPAPLGQRFSLPAWIPGSYLIREFARHVVTLTAASDGRPVHAEKIDKDSWLCAPCAGPLVVTYQVYAWDLSVRAAHLDATHGFFNGTSVFLLVHGKEACRHEVEILPPEGHAYRDWRVATALRPSTAQPYGFGGYFADDYDELADHPVEMGAFTLASFEAAGVPHDIVITGRHHADLERLRADLKKICEHHIRFFGKPDTLERYVFLIMAVGEGYGGLEHRACTALLCSRDDLPRKDAEEMNENYRTFLGLVSHEYFHTWNVKRIKPAAFTPYDWRRENHTRLLWAFEGITSYYDDLALVRTGLIGAEDYLALAGENLTRVLRTHGRLKQSVAESSFDAWTKFYRPDENSPNAVVSYYAKGAVIALALDLTIRLRSGGEKSLDDVMRALWQRHGETGLGVPEDGVERLAAEITGLDLGAFFNQAVRGTEDVNLADLLAEFGVQYTLRPAQNATDKGGKPGKNGNIKPRAVLGVKLAGQHGGAGEAKLLHVYDGGAAQAAGLSAGDVVIAIDGLRVSSGNLDKIIASHTAGSQVRLHAFRRDELMRFDVALQAAPFDTCDLSIDPQAKVAAVVRRDAWLKDAR